MYLGNVKNEFMSRKIERIIVNKVIAKISDKEEMQLKKWLEKKEQNKQIYEDFTMLVKMVHHKNSLFTQH